MTERIMMWILIAAVAYGCFMVLDPFLSAIMWAALLTFVTWPVHVRLRRLTTPIIAAVLMMVICAVCVVLPLGLMTSAVVTDGPAMIASVTSLFAHDMQLPPLPAHIAGLPFVGDRIQATWNHWGNDLGAFSQFIEPYAGRIARSLLILVMQLAAGLLHLVMALFVAFFFWLGGDALGQTSAAIIRRVAGNYAGRLLRLIDGTIRGTVYGILGTAIVQGILTGIGFVLAGLHNAALFGMLAAFVAVLPVGAPLVWIPASIWLVVTDHEWRGVGLAFYGVIAISGADHIIRPMFISRGAQLPYLLTMIGVLGGVMAFGGLGIFLGPVLLGLGYTLISEFAANRGAVSAHSVPPSSVPPKFPIKTSST